MEKVYVKLNSNNIIIEINSDIFLASIEGYIFIDEGNGDKYAHAQNNYLTKSLMDDKGRYNYKYVDGTLIELTESEKEVLFPTREVPLTNDEILGQMSTDAEIERMELGQRITDVELFQMEGGV